MRLSLFSRLTIGYLTIFLLVTAVSANAIFQVRQFVDLTSSITVSNQVLDYEKKLRELLLSQSHYEQRFTMTFPTPFKDEGYFEQFLRGKEDFTRQLSDVPAFGETVKSSVLAKIKIDYQSYQELVAEEVQLLRAKKRYSQIDYKQKKDTIVVGILAAFDKDMVEREQTINTKVRQLEAAANQALPVAVFIGVGCLVAIVLLSLLITRSITRPIALLKSKTRDIAEGRFEGGLRVGSPPEFAELAAAFNLMCEKLNEIDRMKEDFFASMAHELRTPLFCIKEGAAQLLDGIGGETTTKQRDILVTVAGNTDRLVGVVNSLLDLSKMEAGMLNYEFDTVSLDQLIRVVVAEMAPLVEAKQIILETAIDLPLPPTRLDPERMLQVLRNLLGNAVKFTPREGQVRVGARYIGGKLEVSVQDSGPGIPVESLTTIFEKYSQGNHKERHNKEGTGLGLAIAKSIINSHGGEIWAESQLGQGSKFFFVLPCSA
jgi:two-component system sensor histidine kinase GlrK